MCHSFKSNITPARLRHSGVFSFQSTGHVLETKCFVEGCIAISCNFPNQKPQVLTLFGHLEGVREAWVSEQRQSFARQNLVKTPVLRDFGEQNFPKLLSCNGGTCYMSFCALICFFDRLRIMIHLSLLHEFLII